MLSEGSLSFVRSEGRPGVRVPALRGTELRDLSVVLVSLDVTEGVPVVVTTLTVLPVDLTGVHLQAADVLGRLHPLVRVVSVLLGVVGGLEGLVNGGVCHVLILRYDNHGCQDIFCMTI